ncbi:CBS domain-containing protein [Hymenobacter sp. HMF4947]|uniref:CBS domain-containing protein n=1 Tax=Hymenobacter ginkgonis TaxID=2682976 RepID=A0A7K1TLL7_9BACT|nr:CBS domain-containing protein [Hymenobacter ginkgonis]MVN79309.1 CBS domain-containing protein [Hymenobacter ginkgonis]
MRVPVKDLMESATDLAVSPVTSLEAVINTMARNKTSVLPVIDENKALQGAITLRAVAHAWKTMNVSPKELAVGSATMDRLPTLRPQPLTQAADLYEHISDFVGSPHEHLYIIQSESEPELIGFIAKNKLLEFLFTNHKPYLLTREIEVNLKKHITYAYKTRAKLIDAISSLSDSARGNQIKGINMLKEFCKKNGIPFDESELADHVKKYFRDKEKTRELHDLTFSEFVQLIQNNAAWVELEPVFSPHTKELWTVSTNAVRDERNNAFHFRKDIDAEMIDILSSYAEWLLSHPAREVPIAAPLPGHTDEVVEGGFNTLIQFLENNKEVNTTQRQQLEMIKRILGISLPEEAYTQASWWQEDSIYTKQWKTKGWTANADLQAGLITFEATPTQN